MKKINKSSILIIIIILFSILTLFIRKFSNISFLNFFFWLIISVISFYLIGSLKYKKRNKIDTIQLIIICNLINIFFNYMIGLFKGFTNNNINYIFTILILFFIEVTRYSALKNIANKYKYLVSFLFVLPFYITLNCHYLLIFSLIITNILLTYISSSVGVIPSFIHSILINIFYILPIRPNISFIITNIIVLIISIIIYILLSKTYKNNQVYFHKNKHCSLLILLVIIIIIIVFILFGIGNYKFIGIVSNSMLPTFQRGEGIIYRKIDGSYYDNLKVGDIIIYEKNNTYIVHRITKKDNDLLLTKGDNNNDVDDPVTKEQYVGIVKIHLPFIGYPYVWLSEK